MSWSKQDEEFLFKLHLQFGNRWSFIATRMNRAQNTLKNKFYATLRKGYRKINSYIVKIKRKMNPSDFINNKLIKPEFITKIAAISGKAVGDYFIKKYQKLKIEIQQGLFKLVHSDINYGQSDLQNYNTQQNLLIQIHEFNRNCKRRKGKKKDKYDAISSQQSMEQVQPQLRKMEQQEIQPELKIVIKKKQSGFNFVKPESLLNKNPQIEQNKNNCGIKRVSSLEKEELGQFEANPQFPFKFQIFLDDHLGSYNHAEIAKTPYSLVSNNRSFLNLMNPSPFNNEYASFKHAAQATIKRIDSSSLLNSKNYESQNPGKGEMIQDKCQQINFAENIPIMMQNYGNGILFQSTQIKKQSNQDIDFKKKYLSQLQFCDQKFPFRSKSHSLPEVIKADNSPKNERKSTQLYSEAIEK